MADFSTVAGGLEAIKAQAAAAALGSTYRIPLSLATKTTGAAITDGTNPPSPYFGRDLTVGLSSLISPQTTSMAGDLVVGEAYDEQVLPTNFQPGQIFALTVSGACASSGAVTTPNEQAGTELRIAVNYSTLSPFAAGTCDVSLSADMSSPDTLGKATIAGGGPSSSPGAGGLAFSQTFYIQHTGLVPGGLIQIYLRAAAYVGDGDAAEGHLDLSIYGVVMNLIP